MKHVLLTLLAMLLISGCSGRRVAKEERYTEGTVAIIQLGSSGFYSTTISFTGPDGVPHAYLISVDDVGWSSRDCVFNLDPATRVITVTYKGGVFGTFDLRTGVFKNKHGDSPQEYR